MPDSGGYYSLSTAGDSGGDPSNSGGSGGDPSSGGDSGGDPSGGDAGSGDAGDAGGDGSVPGNPGNCPPNDAGTAASISSFTVCSDSDATAAQSTAVAQGGTVTFAWEITGDSSGGITITGTGAPDPGGQASGTATMSPSSTGDEAYVLKVTDGQGLSA